VRASAEQRVAVAKAEKTVELQRKEQIAVIRLIAVALKRIEPVVL
jgi:hypothetical protein